MNILKKVLVFLLLTISTGNFLLAMDNQNTNNDGDNSNNKKRKIDDFDLVKNQLVEAIKKNNFSLVNSLIESNQGKSLINYLNNNNYSFNGSSVVDYFVEVPNYAYDKLPLRDIFFYLLQNGLDPSKAQFAILTHCSVIYDYALFRLLLEKGVSVNIINKGRRNNTPLLALTEYISEHLLEGNDKDKEYEKRFNLLFLNKSNVEMKNKNNVNFISYLKLKPVRTEIARMAYLKFLMFNISNLPLELGQKVLDYVELTDV